jgi:hypothetical protein
MKKIYKLKNADESTIAIRRCSGFWNVYLNPEELPTELIGIFKTKREAINNANKVWSDIRTITTYVAL